MISLNDPLFLQYIKKPLIILVVFLAVFTAIGYYFADLQNDYERIERANERSLTQILNQVKFLRSQKSLFVKYGSKYQESLENGLAHEIDRVKWTDELLKVQEKLSLYDFNIQFEAEQKITSNQSKYLKISKNIFYYAKLNILSGVHSDLDVLNIFNAIDKEITPLYLINSCELDGDPKRLNLNKFDKTKPLFNLKCSIVLLQAKPSKFNLK